MMLSFPTRSLLLSSVPQTSNNIIVAIMYVCVYQMYACFDLLVHEVDSDSSINPSTVVGCCCCVVCLLDLLAVQHYNTGNCSANKI